PESRAGFRPLTVLWKDPRIGFLDDFDAPSLDRDAWLPHYLPHWSSRAASAATYAVEESELRLTIPTGHGLWCEGDHEPPLRVSGGQSGARGRPHPFRERHVEDARVSAGQPFRDGQVVREPGRTWWGVTPQFGRLEVRARMELSPRS